MKRNKFKFWFVLIVLITGGCIGYSVYKNRQLVGSDYSPSTSSNIDTQSNQSISIIKKPTPIKIYKDSIGELPCISIINYEGKKTIAVLITNTGSIVLDNSVASKIIINNTEQKEVSETTTDTTISIKNDKHDCKSKK